MQLVRALLGGHSCSIEHWLAMVITPIRLLLILIINTIALLLLLTHTRA